MAMGPAVFHGTFWIKYRKLNHENETYFLKGGFSTFLAFALTYMSDSYFFIAFATVSTGRTNRIHAGNGTDLSKCEVFIRIPKKHDKIKKACSLMTKLRTFQMFGFVVLFGLLHALFFLPICLSIMGPLRQPDEDEPGGNSNRERAAENGREMQRFLEKNRTENAVVVDAAAEQPNVGADQMVSAV